MRTRTESLQRLSGRMEGRLVIAGDYAYDEARRVWNGVVDKRPAAIAYCRGADDVRRALETALDAGLKIAIRSGGHNIAGRSLVDDGLVIDLSSMKTRVVDPRARRIRAEAGLTLAEFDAATQAFGCATTMGVNGTTGIAGLTLGGGFGKLGRRFGLACDNLIEAELVTPDGTLVRASETLRPDLFWGLRGGGAGLGVVTAFHYRVHEIGTEVTTVNFGFRWSVAADALRAFWDFAVSAPDHVNLDAALFRAGGQKMFGVSVFNAGPADETMAALAPFIRRASTLGVEPQCHRRQYREVQTAGDATFPKGRRYFWKAQFFERLPDAAIGVLIEHYGRAPSADSMLVFQQVGGAIARVPPEATAYAHRQAAYDCFPVAIWDDPARDAEHAAWVRDFWSALRPFSTGGVYANNLGEEGAQRQRDAYGANWSRLQSLRATVDPHGVLAGDSGAIPA